MALVQKYKIPYFDICEAKQSVLKEYEIEDILTFECNGNYKYNFAFQAQPILQPIRFNVYGLKANATISYSIPYNEPEEAYLDGVIADVIGSFPYDFSKDDMQNSSKNINPNAKTGVSPIVTYNVTFRWEIFDCDSFTGDIIINYNITSNIYYKIIKIKKLSV